MVLQYKEPCVERVACVVDLLAPRPDGPDTLQSRAMGPIQLFPPPVRAGPLKDPDPGGELETNGTGVYVYFILLV